MLISLISACVRPLQNCIIVSCPPPTPHTCMPLELPPIICYCTLFLILMMSLFFVVVFFRNCEVASIRKLKIHDESIGTVVKD